MHPTLVRTIILWALGLALGVLGSLAILLGWV
jgi:hypothetical protein